MNKTAISTALAAGLAASALGAGIGAYTTDTSYDKTPKEKLRHRLQNAGIGLATGGLAGYGLTSAAQQLDLINKDNKAQKPVGFIRGITNWAAGAKTDEEIEKETEGKSWAEAAAIEQENRKNQATARAWENQVSLNPLESSVAAGTMGGGIGNIAGGIYQRIKMPALQTISQRIAEMKSINTGIAPSTPAIAANVSMSNVDLHHLGIGPRGSFATREQLDTWLRQRPALTNAEYFSLMGVPVPPTALGSDTPALLRNRLNDKVIALSPSTPAVAAHNAKAIGPDSLLNIGRETYLNDLDRAAARVANGTAKGPGFFTPWRQSEAEQIAHLRPQWKTNFGTRTLPRSLFTIASALLSADIPNLVHSYKKTQ